MIRTETLRDGAVERIVLDRPKANVLDAEMIGAITEHLCGLVGRDPLRLVVFEGAGKHFSFGASVEEHLPDTVRQMLQSFHSMFRALEGLGVPTASLVRGQCLGGGCELAIATGRVFAHPSASFALPEVKLAVFPPLGAVLLPLRVGGARAADLVITGSALDGAAAAEAGLADVCTEDPEAALWAWFDAGLADRSAVAVRHAWRAVRRPFQRAIDEDLPAIERMYLDELMTHRDPVEGLGAFLERRAPQWSHQ